MTDVAQTIQDIEAAAEDLGLPELARQAGVPYTTLADWKAKGWRPRPIQTFERLATVADIASKVRIATRAAVKTDVAA